MNKQILTVLVFLSLGLNAFLLFLHYSSPSKIAYVDTVKLLNEYKGMQAAREAYQAKAVGWQANVDSLTLEVQNKIKAHEKNFSKMSKKEIELSKELINTKQQQLMQYQQVIQQKAQQEDQQMTSKVLATVNSYLKEYGKSNQYLVILAANEMGNIAYAEETIEITDEVLKGLNGN